MRLPIVRTEERNASRRRGDHDGLPPLPDGFLFLVDENGAYLLDEEGAYIIVETA